ncbi:hypothetical protein WAI453_002033 [Rhynchosporium graminicola]
MYTEEAEAYAEAVKNTRPSMNQYKQREYKYVILDNDTIDTDYKPVKKTRLASTFKIVNTSSNKLVLHAINRTSMLFDATSIFSKPDPTPAAYSSTSPWASWLSRRSLLFG